MLPELPVFRSDKQIVQHFVVGQQDIWGRESQGFFIGNKMVTAHQTPLIRISLLLADIDTSSHMSFKLTVMDKLCQPAGLVRGQGIHGIDEDGLDSRFSPMLVAVIKDGVEETFCFAGTGTGGDYCGLGIRAGQPVK